ncbi:hypothetical protein QR680_006743 [Steinernema hermaphroditum]|uniref:FLYWCH-type domain-containing protein n=1 Tax=Steinernema hermaphroditum TaxID=289476 RepID=A0AA39HYW0_9BILA|nr:hypothetical protein QR680_006743 [Steinernema hermaphroditum]
MASSKANDFPRNWLDREVKIEQNDDDLFESSGSEPSTSLATGLRDGLSSETTPTPQDNGSSPPNEQEEVTFVPGSSQRTRVTDKLGRGVYMHGGYTYRRERTMKKLPGFITCRCIFRECAARARVNEDNCKGFVVRQHNHEPDFTKQTIRQARDALEAQARAVGNGIAATDAVRVIRSTLGDDVFPKANSEEAYLRAFERARKRARQEEGNEVREEAALEPIVSEANFGQGSGSMASSDENNLLENWLDREVKIEQNDDDLFESSGSEPSTSLATALKDVLSSETVPTPQDNGPLDEQEEVTFVPGSSKRTRVTDKLGRGVYMYGGYTYRRERTMKKLPGFITCRCIFRECAARARVNEDNCKGFVVKQHNHEPDFNDQSIRQARDALEAQARAVGNGLGATDAVRVIRSTLGDDVLSAASSEKAYLRAFQRGRKRARQEVNNEVREEAVFSSSEPIVSEEFREVDFGQGPERFLLTEINKDDSKMAVFMSTFGKTLLERSRNISICEASTSSPHLFVISAYLDNLSLPAAYCIYSKKSPDVYRTALDAVNAELACNKKPLSIIADLERNVTNAASMVWPLATIGLSTYRLGTEVFSKIQSNADLLWRYNTNEEDRALMDSLQYLAFVPLTDLYHTFCTLWDSTDEMEDLFTWFFTSYIGRYFVPKQPFVDLQPGWISDSIIRDQILSKHRADPSFSPREWNLYGREKQLINNSMKQGFSRSMTSDSTIFLDIIRSEEVFSRELFNENCLAKPCYVEKDLWSVVEQYDEKSEDPVQYLKELASIYPRALDLARLGI